MTDIWLGWGEFSRWFTENEPALFVITLFVLAPFVWWKIRTLTPGINEFLVAYGKDKLGNDRPNQTWGTDQAWRTPTGVRLLEEYKATLLSHEELVKKGREAALAIQKRRATLREQQAGYLKTTWFEFRTRTYSDEPIKQGRLLCEQLDRLWAGDAHIEIEDRNDRLRLLKRELGELREDQTYSRNRLNDQIVAVERELRDLAEIVRRAQERGKVSPHEAKLRDAREIHEKDVHHDMTKAFLGVLSQMEIFRKRAELKQQVTNDPGFTEEEKERLIATIESAAAAADSKPVPARQPKPGSIYKEDRG